MKKIETDRIWNSWKVVGGPLILLAFSFCCWRRCRSGVPGGYQSPLGLACGCIPHAPNMRNPGQEDELLTIDGSPNWSSPRVYSGSFHSIMTLRRLSLPFPALQLLVPSVSTPMRQLLRCLPQPLLSSSMVWSRNAIHITLPPLISDVWESILRAVPKKKTSHMKKRHRQMAGKALKDTIDVNTCSGCGQPKRAHLLCPTCVSGMVPKHHWNDMLSLMNMTYQKSKSSGESPTRMLFHQPCSMLNMS